MPVYRVTATRHFTDAFITLDIEAKTKGEAKQKARRIAESPRYARELRRTKIDTGWWIIDEPNRVPVPGSWARGVHETREITPGVYVIK